MTTDFAKYFNPFRNPKKAEIDSDVEEINLRNELLEFAETSYYAKLLNWLDYEASRPLITGSHEEMITSAVRANTLREIRSTIVSRVEQARAATMDDTE